MDTQQKQINYVCDKIKQLIKVFQKYPFMYFYEADIQADLYYNLMNGCNKLPDFRGKCNNATPWDVQETSPFKCQYPSKDKWAKARKTGQFDIAYFDISDEIKEKCTDKDQLNTYNLPVLIAIEIKLCKPTDWGKYFKQDINKLINYSIAKYRNQNVGFTGIGIWLCQRKEEWWQETTKPVKASINTNNISISLNYETQCVDALSLYSNTIHSILVPPKGVIPNKDNDILIASCKIDDLK